MENTEEKELVPFVILARYYNTTLTDKFIKRKFWVNPIKGEVRSYLPGTVDKIFVVAGQEVKKGDILLIQEAMKMKNRILSPVDGVVKNIDVSEGDKIKKDTLMVFVQPKN